MARYDYIDERRARNKWDGRAPQRFVRLLCSFFVCVLLLPHILLSVLTHIVVLRHGNMLPAELIVASRFGAFTSSRDRVCAIFPRAMRCAVPRMCVATSMLVVICLGGSLRPEFAWNLCTCDAN